ncbi:hypothetical protein RUM44_001689 [Polyplax serrata]|uniref:Pentraxin (PTX) domain-containing protein n=1 Tax=Polyplax serrata TaxID=468196 RepID=A0ABR1AKS6_POLSC
MTGQHRINFTDGNEFLTRRKAFERLMFSDKKWVFVFSELDARKPTTVLSYPAIFKKTPSNFVMYSAIPKPAKTLYYGEPELLTTKLPTEVKYLTHNVQGSGNDIKIFLQPDQTPIRQIVSNPFDEHCPLYKVSFQQSIYYQYVQYKTRMPDLKEFTICMWVRLHNHSHDHSLLSYAAKPHHKDIYMWISNLNAHEPALFNMKVMGQTIFRLNYPIQLYKWYHTCQSWNGNTGEWQVWVNSHRIGRGFHNLLVGQKIPGKGIALSGQENRYFGKDFQEVAHYQKAVGGLQGEITMVQMYKIALTAGKAYTDHRHHHSHYTSTTPEPPEEPTEEMPTTTEHPLLENGQLKTRVNIIELVESLKKKGHLEGLEEPQGDFGAYTKHFPIQFSNGGTTFVTHGNALHYAALPDHTIFKREDGNKSAAPKSKPSQDTSEEANSSSEEESQTAEQFGQRKKIKVLNKVRQVRVEKVKHPLHEVHGGSVRFKNNTASVPSESFTDSVEESDELSDESEVSLKGSRAPRHRRYNAHSTLVLTGSPKSRSVSVHHPVKLVRTTVKKRRGEPKTVVKKLEKKKEPAKRFLVLADHFSNAGTYDLLGHSHFGSSLDSTGHHGLEYQLPQFEQEHEEVQNPLHEPNHEDHEPPQHELAENEVRRVMLMCSGCHVDPFRKVAVISWRSTPKKVYSGALLLKAKSECENF